MDASSWRKTRRHHGASMYSRIASRRTCISGWIGRWRTSSVTGSPGLKYDNQRHGAASNASSICCGSLPSSWHTRMKSLGLPVVAASNAARSRAVGGIARSVTVHHPSSLAATYPTAARRLSLIRRLRMHRAGSTMSRGRWGSEGWPQVAVGSARGLSEQTHPVRLLDSAQRSVVVAPAAEGTRGGCRDHDRRDVAAAARVPEAPVGRGGGIPGDDHDPAVRVPLRTEHRGEVGLQPIVSLLDLADRGALAVHVVTHVGHHEHEARCGVAGEVAREAAAAIERDDAIALSRVCRDALE